MEYMLPSKGGQEKPGVPSANADSWILSQKLEFEHCAFNEDEDTSLGVEHAHRARYLEFARACLC